MTERVSTPTTHKVGRRLQHPDCDSSQRYGCHRDTPGPWTPLLDTPHYPAVLDPPPLRRTGPLHLDKGPSKETLRCRESSEMGITCFKLFRQAGLHSLRLEVPLDFFVFSIHNQVCTAHLPDDRSPSSPQTTSVSACDQWSLQMVPQTPPWHTSTLPSVGVSPSASLTPPSLHSNTSRSGAPTT